MKLMPASTAAADRRDGVVNFGNQHVWADENLHAVEETRHQHRFSANVRAGVLSDRLIWPYVLSQRLTGARYQDYPINVLPTLPEHVPCQQRLQMWLIAHQHILSAMSVNT
ncbi:hypothetical protein ANN_09273 [Periplaneta americana]|uniref:Uncharacterized protein n=1 Tax=Periplaneta americana TaxID=6978 RepID=A0ABQ8TLA1_PERAM|nr:hypothetical protein ANN_09273 [Periplaneta americana]